MEPGLGVRGGPEGRQGGGSGGGLLVLVLVLVRPFRCCARSCSSQDVPPRCQQLLWGLMRLSCGRERPSKLRGGCGGAVHGHLRGGCDGACGGLTGFAWATGRGTWLWRWWSRWGDWWGSAAASPCPWSRRSPLEGVFCGCRGGAQAASPSRTVACQRARAREPMCSAYALASSTPERPGSRRSTRTISKTVVLRAGGAGSRRRGVVSAGGRGGHGRWQVGAHEQSAHASSAETA